MRGDSQRAEGSLFDRWIAEHLEKLREKEFIQLKRDGMEAETRRNIIEAAEKLLNAMEN